MPPKDRINADHLRTLRDLYMLARRNGLSIAKASARVADKAHALGAGSARKYVQVIVEQVDGGENE